MDLMDLMDMPQWQQNQPLGAHAVMAADVKKCFFPVAGFLKKYQKYAILTGML